MRTRLAAQEQNSFISNNKLASKRATRPYSLRSATSAQARAASTHLAPAGLFFTAGTALGGGIAALAGALAAADEELAAPADPDDADVSAAPGGRSSSAKPLLTYYSPLVRLAGSILLRGFTIRMYAAM